MILEVKNVEYAYKSQKERKVLDNISVRFEDRKASCRERVCQYV